MYDLCELFLIRKVQGNKNDEDCSKCKDDQCVCRQYNLLKTISLKNERKIYHITICCQFIFLYFYVLLYVFLAMFVFVLCLMCPMLSSASRYRYCPFVIAPSVFSIVRFQLTLNLLWSLPFSKKQRLRRTA